MSDQGMYWKGSWKVIPVLTAIEACHVLARFGTVASKVTVASTAIFC